jgi:hypothetical protein
MLLKPNTVNKGHLYCHNFCSLLLLSIKFKIIALHPDTHICSPSKSCTRINFLVSGWLCTAILRQWLRSYFLYRDSIRGHTLACTAIAPARHKNCTRIAKIAPCFTHYGFGGILVIARIQSSPPIDSATQTPFIAVPLAFMRANNLGDNLLIS